MEVTNFGEVHDRVTNSVRVIIHVETGLVIHDATELPWRFPFQPPNVVASGLERFKDAFALFDASDSHLQALGIHVCPFRPALFPPGFPGEFVLHLRIRGFVVVRAWPVFLREGVIIHFPARLNIGPCSGGCRGAVRRCSVLERLLNHY